MRFLNTIIDILFPSRCIGCRQRGPYLCLSCLTLYPPAERESARWIYPLFDYRHPPIKKVLWNFKYSGKKVLAKILAPILYEKIIEEFSELRIMKNFRSPILIPIPLSKRRYKERGYNQAELLCRELVNISHLRDSVDWQLETNVLLKLHDTGHQARIRNRTERLKNIIGSFAVNENKKDIVQGRNIILIDDILTTGATLSEAKKVLKGAGARKVIAFTIAH